ncbi:MAG: hypothetical protein WAV05_18270 [Anaerolineales bacterium]
MKDRSLAVIITIIAVILCGCPGLAFLCFGVTDFIDHYALNSYFYGIYSQTAANLWGIVGICSGILFIVIAIVVSILVLRKKNGTTPPSPNEPIPPTL